MLHAEAARNALADAGPRASPTSTPSSAPASGWASETAEYLGIRPRYIDGTQIGGCSFIAHVQHAMAAIDAGIVDVALITHGESGASRVGMPGTRFGPDAFRMQFEKPFGLAGPPTGYALAAARHMHEYGTTSEQLAEVAVATRKWAQLNPRAIMRDPLTVDDVLALAHDLVAAPPARLLPRDRRRRRRRASRRPSARATCRRSPSTCSAPARRRRTSCVSQMPDFAFWDAAQHRRRARLRDGRRRRTPTSTSRCSTTRSPSCR